MAVPPQKMSTGRVVELAWRGLVVLLAGGLLLVILARWTGWEGRAGWQQSDDAYLQSDQTPIAARVSGYLRAVPVQDFQHVTAGAVLAQIDDEDYRAAVDQAQAGVASAEAQAEALKAQRPLLQANARAARAVVDAIAASLEQNGRDLKRQQALFAGGSSTPEAGEKLSTLAEQISAQLRQDQAQADAADRQLGVLTAQQEQARASVSAAQAALQTARINLGYTRIVAPQDGVVGQRQVRPGQFVPVGGQITTLIPLPRLWVIANFKETQLTHMAVGDRALVTVDAYPGRTLRGHVLAFSPGSGSQFALLPPDNATGNFTKVVQRVGVKILVDDDDGLTDRLRAGMSVVARIDARDGRRS
jgi:membrane fusion protein (multidrug efflux system)